MYIQGGGGHSGGRTDTGETRSHLASGCCWWPIASARRRHLSLPCIKTQKSTHKHIHTNTQTVSDLSIANYWAPSAWLCVYWTRTASLCAGNKFVQLRAWRSFCRILCFFWLCCRKYFFPVWVCGKFCEINAWTAEDVANCRVDPTGQSAKSCYIPAALRTLHFVVRLRSRGKNLEMLAAWQT